MRFGRGLLVPAVVLTIGCIQGQRVIKVNTDGSGTITDTVTLGEQARGMLQAMEEMDKTPPAEKKAKKTAKLKERAAAMGTGVTLVSYEPSVKDGPEKIIYSFKDVSALRIDPAPDSTANDSKPGEKDPITFRFEKKGATSVVTVLGAGPKAKKPESPAAKPDKDAAEAAAKMQAQGMAMMKTMLKGLKMTTILEVAGPIVKTNGLNVEGSRLTLLDLDFDQIAADEATFKKFSAMSDDPKNIDPAMLKGLKGIKVQTAPEVTVEFGK